MTSEHDVLVIGLGPVGATAANFAGSLGLDCVGVDSSPDVFGLPRAIHFDADVMRIFQALGLGEAVSGICRSGKGSVHLGADGEPIRDFRVEGAVGDLGWSPHYMFYQPQLDHLLRDSAAARPGVDLLLGWSCEHVSQGVDGATAVLRHANGEKREVRARYLIACDGASSLIRRQLGIELFDFGFEEDWIVVDMLVPSADLGPDYMVTHCNPARPLVYVPGPENHRRWEFMVLPGEDPAEASDPAHIRELIDPAAPWLGEAELVRSAIYTFHGLVARTWADQSIVLAGDAAHQTPPFYGQGMCHGIRDVRNLLWKLAMVLRGEANERLLDSYQAEREPHVSRIIEAAVENGRYICVLDPELARQRDLSYRKKLREGTDVGTWRRLIPGLAAGLLDDRPHRSPAVGELIPQPTVIDGEAGQEMLLDELLGFGFSILTRDDGAGLESTWFVEDLGGSVVSIAVAEEPDEVVKQVIDTTGSLGAWFDQTNCDWAIIRPDHYVFGVAGEFPELEALIARLREMLAGECPLASAETLSEGMAAK